MVLSSAFVQKLSVASHAVLNDVGKCRFLRGPAMPCAHTYMHYTNFFLICESGHAPCTRAFTFMRMCMSIISVPNLGRQGLRTPTATGPSSAPTHSVYLICRYTFWFLPTQRCCRLRHSHGQHFMHESLGACAPGNSVRAPAHSRYPRLV